MSNYPPPATSFLVVVPDWLTTIVDDLPSRLPDPDDRIRLLNELALRNVHEGTGGPFSAMVIDTDTAEIISVGVNLVLASGLSGMHAEVVALSLAQARLGQFTLAGSETPRRSIVVNAQPCVMCLGAICWSGVTSLECSASGAVVEEITGFDEGPVPTDWIAQLEARGISVATGRLERESEVPLRAFRARVDAGEGTLYNGRD